MRWWLAVGLAFLGNDRMEEPPTRSPPVLVPGAVTDLHVAARSGLTVPAKYVIRYDTLRAGGFDWGAVKDVLTGGYAAPIYGATAGGGRARACVLGGLKARRGYHVQLVAYTGALGSATFGPMSNVAMGATAQRVGPMLVSRPLMLLDTLDIAAASLPYDFGPRRYPLHGRFPAGDRVISFYDSTGTLTAYGYVLVVKPQ